MGSRGRNDSCRRTCAAPVRPHYAVITMTAPYVPGHGSIIMRSSPQFSPRHDVLVHGVHHHARQQRRLWPIRPVGPSAFTVTTTPLCCTPLCLGSTVHDDEPDHSSKMETGSLVKQVRLLGLVPRPLGRTIVAETTGGVRAAGVVDADGAARSRAGLCAHRVVLLGSTWIRGSRV